MSEEEASLIMNKLMKALNYCHSNNIMHRDIKPQNIVIGDDGEYKLVDFGFAKVQQQPREKLETLGTPYYLAPEVIGGFYGKECDIWSMGVVIYQMLTGKMPFNAGSIKDLIDIIEKGEFEMPESFTDELKDLIT